MEPEVFCAISDGPGSNRAVRMPMVEIFARTTSLPLFFAEFIAAHNDWKPFSMRLKESDVAAPSNAAPISASSFGSGTGTWECARLRACRDRTTNRDGAIVSRKSPRSGMMVSKRGGHYAPLTCYQTDRYHFTCYQTDRYHCNLGCDGCGSCRARPRIPRWWC